MSAPDTDYVQTMFPAYFAQQLDETETCVTHIRHLGKGPIGFAAVYATLPKPARIMRLRQHLPAYQEYPPVAYRHQPYQPERLSYEPLPRAGSTGNPSAPKPQTPPKPAPVPTRTSTAAPTAPTTPPQLAILPGFPKNKTLQALFPHLTDTACALLRTTLRTLPCTPLPLTSENAASARLWAPEHAAFLRITSTSPSRQMPPDPFRYSMAAEILECLAADTTTFPSTVWLVRHDPKKPTLFLTAIDTPAHPNPNGTRRWLVDTPANLRYALDARTT